ncbi:MAG: 2Fe-2S iron-sulfur cluster-binding protein, partial [Anaerolineae bacterium]
MRFEPSGETVQAPTGALLSEVARQAGLDLNMPCGGQGRCGRCAVIVQDGAGVRRRSTLRLTSDDLAAGYALACQTVIEGDAAVTIPPQEKIERRLVTDKTADKVSLPFVYDPVRQQPMRLFPLTLDPPSMADQTDDWSRLRRAMVGARLPLLARWDPVSDNWLHLKEAVDATREITDLVADLPT